MLYRWPYMKGKVVTKIFHRSFSNKSRITLPFSEKVLALHSQYNDPYLNLAYENWMYENLNLERHDVLYFWQNSPCVVIGRHQNPWLECDLQYLKEHDIKLARRFSGGGTVYHDLGNLNVTFLSNRSRYNRKQNLECIAKALMERWSLDVEISPRDDLLVDGLFKISGSAAKLGKFSSYHHCTLLWDVNLNMLKNAIIPKTLVTQSRATPSVSSHVINLKDIEPSMTVPEIITSVAQTYTQKNLNLMSMNVFREHLGEVDKIRNGLSTWQWIFGKTSPFTVTKSILLPSFQAKVKIDLEIKSGRIDNIAFFPSLPQVEDEINKHLKGINFESHELSKTVHKCLEKHIVFQDYSMEKDFREVLISISNIA